MVEYINKLSKHFIGTRLLLIAAEISQEYSEPFQTSKMNIFGEINGCKDEYKILSISWMNLFLQVATSHREKFRIFSNI